VSVPGAFTPGCQALHLPPFIEKLPELKSKGVDIVAVIASNDAWVMNAWGKVNHVKGDDILFLSDTKTLFSKNHGWAAGMGDRNGRWAMIISSDGTVKYADVEKVPFTLRELSKAVADSLAQGPGQVTVSGADAVLSKL
jgi:alkyl hydroperoxide reductase 1